MLSQEEFQILYRFQVTKVSQHVTQRMLAEELSVSLGKTNQIMNNLLEKRLIETGADGEYQITKNGVEALEPYRVQNAVIMAAGMSSRFAPLSYERPKGLLSVRGDILIEREIRQLQEAGITDITVVVGYMQEKFFYLEDKFGVRIVVNEDYYRYNNTSTLIRVLDRLSNTYICSSDNYFVDNVFEPYVYRAYYSAVYEAGETNEYCVECDGKGKIKQVVVGGRASWYMMGHVYFDRAFSEAFSEILKREYHQADTKEHLWEDLYIRYIRSLTMYMRKYSKDKVLEFDSLEELREFDPAYINNADSKILWNISRVLGCETGDIVNIRAITSGGTHTSFQFYVDGRAYVYRHPKKRMGKHLNRKSEAFSLQAASGLHLDDSFIYMDETDGWKISYDIDRSRGLDVHDPREVSQALDMMRILHTKNIQSAYDFDIWEKAMEYRKQLTDLEYDDFEDFDRLYELLRSVQLRVGEDPAEKCLCHCSCFPSNFRIDHQGKMYLLDWEYSGNDDPASDLGTFLASSDYRMEEAVAVIGEYLGHPAKGRELAHYLAYTALTAYYWYLWTLYQKMSGKHADSRLYTWYQHAKGYAKQALKLYSEEDG